MGPLAAYTSLVIAMSTRPYRHNSSGLTRISGDDRQGARDCHRLWAGPLRLSRYVVAVVAWAEPLRLRSKLCLHDVDS
jgi:hypothetical protein